jgi:hypothetical protein
MIVKSRSTDKVNKPGKTRNLKLVRSNPPAQVVRREHSKLRVNDDGTLVADFDPGFVTLHNKADSIVMSWPEAVELALAIAVHARLPM